MPFFTKKNLRRWINIILVLGSIAVIPVGWLAAQASTSAKLAATLAIVVALFTTVLPAKRKEIIEAVDKSDLPEDDAGKTCVPVLWLLLYVAIVLYTGILCLGCA